MANCAPRAHRPGRALCEKEEGLKKHGITNSRAVRRAWTAGGDSGTSPPRAGSRDQRGFRSSKRPPQRPRQMAGSRAVTEPFCHSCSWCHHYRGGNGGLRSSGACPAGHYCSCCREDGLPRQRPYPPSQPPQGRSRCVPGLGHPPAQPERQLQEPPASPLARSPAVGVRTGALRADCRDFCATRRRESSQQMPHSFPGRWGLLRLSEAGASRSLRPAPTWGGGSQRAPETAEGTQAPAHASPPRKAQAPVPPPATAGGRRGGAGENRVPGPRARWLGLPRLALISEQISPAQVHRRIK